MLTADDRQRRPRPRAVLGFMMLLLIAAHPAATMAADTARTDFQKTVRDSMEALWTGQEFTTELKKRQQAMQTMLNSGVVQKAELEGLMEASFLTLFDRQKTSRYIQKALPERVNNLLSPHMSWEDVNKTMWRAMSSVVKSDDPIFIRVGTLAPPGTPWLTVPENMAISEIEKLSGGKLQIKIYGGGVMGEDTDILKKMEADQVDGCGCTALGVIASSPDASALVLPGLFKNYEEVDYICEKFRRDLDKAFEEKGYVLAALVDTGFFYLFSKNDVTGLADIKKQKVATWFGAVETALYQELGINPKPVTTPELVTALSSDLVNVNLSPAAWVLGMQAYQYSHFYLKPPLLYSPAAVIVTTHMKDKLQKQMGVSPVFAFNIQEILVSEFTALEPEWKRQIRSYEEKSLRAFETKCGMKAVTFSPEDQQAIEKAGKNVQQKLAGKIFSRELMDEIQKALEAYRARR